MKSIIHLAATITIMAFASCEGEAVEPSSSVLKFDSLVSEIDEIYYSLNPSTKITAYATGDGLKYYWSATAGEIFGSGNQVTYTANPGCCGGDQTIRCIVQDKSKNSDLKEVIIYVGF
jgi:hypothetical protein